MRMVVRFGRSESFGLEERAYVFGGGGVERMLDVIDWMPGLELHLETNSPNKIRIIGLRFIYLPGRVISEGIRMPSTLQGDLHLGLVNSKTHQKSIEWSIKIYELYLYFFLKTTVIIL